MQASNVMVPGKVIVPGDRPTMRAAVMQASNILVPGKVIVPVERPSMRAAVMQASNVMVPGKVIVQGDRPSMRAELLNYAFHRPRRFDPGRVIVEPKIEDEVEPKEWESI